MTCPNQPAYVYIPVESDPEGSDSLPVKVACPEHLENVLNWLIIDYNLPGAYVMPIATGTESVTGPCAYMTPEEVQSVLTSKKRILEEMKRRGLIPKSE